MRLIIDVTPSLSLKGRGWGMGFKLKIGKFGSINKNYILRIIYLGCYVDGYALTPSARGKFSREGIHSCQLFNNSSYFCRSFLFPFDENNRYQRPALSGPADCN